MNAIPCTSPLTQLARRAMLVVISPRTCWNTIADEQDSPSKLVLGIIIPLSCIGALCTIVGLKVFGIYVPFFGPWRPGLFSSITNQILVASMTLAAFFADAWVIEKLAPEFQKKISYERAFSLVAYASIPWLLEGILGIVPSLLAVVSFLHMGDIFSLCLLYHGFKKMAVPKGTPQTEALTQDKFGLFASSAAAIIVIHALAILMVPALDPSAFTDIGARIQ